MNALTTTDSNARIVHAPLTALVPNSFDQAVRLAQLMSRARMVPKHLQGDEGTCFMIVEQAMRWRMSPFAVAQATSNVHGTLMFQGKLIAAAVETSGALIGTLDYQFSGSGLDRAVTVIGRRAGDAEPKTVEVKLKDARTDNQIWNKQPDQQLVYHGARVWARRWTPAVVLGVYSPEEFNNGQTPEPFAGTTIDAKAASVNDHDTARSLNDGIPALDEPPPEDKAKAGADALIERFNAATTELVWTALDADKTIRKQRDWLREHRPQFSELVEDAIRIAYGRVAPLPIDEALGMPEAAQ